MKEETNQPPRFASQLPFPDLTGARSAAEIARARHALADFAARMTKEGATALATAAVISRVVRDVTAAASMIAEEAMAADGWGPAPASWALLVLGSAGRGESLLAFDQDNAIVHDGEPSVDPWFAELGRRLSDILDEGGIPYCPGGVMARNPAWRRSLAGWKDEIRRWVFEPALETVMSVDIFFDFQPVRGEPALAVALKDDAVATAAQSAFFLRFLTLNTASQEVPVGLFGRFVTADGVINAKKTGLLPVVGVARARALAAGITATGTAERYRRLAAEGLMSEADLRSVLDAHETVLDVILRQQLADIAAGRPPTTLIKPNRLPRAMRQRLKAAFIRIGALVAVAGGL